MTLTVDEVIAKHVTPEMRERSIANLPLLCELAMRCWPIEGDVAEVGVYKGGSAKLLQSLFPDRSLWLFDTFSGNPPAGPRDGNHVGTFAAKEADVRTYLDRPGTTILTGLFPQTAGCIADKRFTLVHLDCDQEQSISDGCAFFWPRLNGVIICDDYGNGSCGGAKYAFDTFFEGVAPIYRMQDRAFVWQHTSVM